MNKTHLAGLLSLIAFAACAPSARADEATTTDPVLVHMEIATKDARLFSGDVAVSPCSASASSSPTANGYCAVRQSGLSDSWSSWGDDEFLDSVSGSSSDSASGTYWNWFSNDEYGQTSLNKHLLSQDERLFVTLGMPLRISLATTSPDANSTTTARVLEFGFDSSWNGTWLPSASSSVIVGDSSLASDGQGAVDLWIGTTSPFSIYAVKDSFVPSVIVTITPKANATSSAPAVDPDPQTEAGGAPSASGGGSSAVHHMPDTPKALEFLESRAQPDGSFGSSLYTDWGAIALAAGPQGTARDRIYAYLRSSAGTFASATDYERHAMVLMALGIDPYKGTATDYIQEIVRRFDGAQIGDPSLVNDDIFALFPLVKAGYSADDPIVRKVIGFVLDRQAVDGSWEESVDLTAAGIQALSLATSAPGAGDALVRARSFLSSRQQADGGFGSGFSTSWAIQAIVALGESPDSWAKGGSTPYDFLYASQGEDGGMEKDSPNDGTRVWATAYAIPALLGKPWPALLSSFSRPVSDEPSEEAASVPSSAISAAAAVASTTASSSLAAALTPIAPVLLPRVVPVALAVEPKPAKSPIAPVIQTKQEDGKERAEGSAIGRSGSQEIVQLAAAGSASPPGIVYYGTAAALVASLGLYWGLSLLRK